MDEKPKRRRWFRFRLSTVLILTAIAAWAMATRPWGGLSYGSSTPNFHEINVGYIPGFEVDYWQIAISSYATTRRGLYIYIGPNPQLAWPAVALIAFIAWKTAWAVGPRLVRRRPSAA